MPTRVRIQHRNNYEFANPVILGPHVIRLRPAQHTRAEVSDYQLRIGMGAQHGDHYLHWQSDAIFNWIGRLVMPTAVTSLEIVSAFEVGLAEQNPFDFFVDSSVERYPFRKSWDPILQPFREVAEPSASFKAFCEGLSREPRMVDFLVAVTKQICGLIRYEIREQPGIQTCAETITCRSGSCRDTAWLMVNVLRSFGIAARFAAGYLIELKTPEHANEPNPVAEDSVAYHAWAEAYLPGAGWIGLDPTSGYLAAERHIPLAVGIRPDDVAAIEGSHSPTAASFSSEICVSRMSDSSLLRTHDHGNPRRRGSIRMTTREPDYRDVTNT